MYTKHKLNNGIRIVTEDIPYVKSVSIGLWVEAGSRYESKMNNGISHFIEHMLFKGTKNRSAKKIAEDIDSIGGQLNAFTSKECTCYYAKVLDSHLDIAIDVLSDMLFNSIFDEKEIMKEKSVVTEEINMYEDSAEELAHDLLSQTIFDNHPLSFPILGKKNTIANINRKSILEYFNLYYSPENLVISVVGNIDEEQVLNLLEEKFGDWKNSIKDIPNSPKPPFVKRNFISKEKDTEQLHLCVGLEGVQESSDSLYSLLVLNNLFGGSMSSRLFQRVREDKGLAYSIYSYPSTYKDTGTFTIYAGLNPKEIINLSEIIIQEIMNIKKNNFSSDEIYKSKEQLKGNYILGLESTSSRMSALGKSELLRGKVNTQREIINKIDEVSKRSINDLIEKIFNYNKMNIAYVGKLENSDRVKNKLLNLYNKK